MELVDKKQTISRFEEVFKQMWINNGNEISKIYAGTGAIQGGSKVCKAICILLDISVIESSVARCPNTLFFVFMSDTCHNTFMKLSKTTFI